MSLTIAYITSRREPEMNWFFDSLRNQVSDEQPKVIVVDLYCDSREIPEATHVPPKPNVWQGEHRLTKEDWWAKSNAMNTAIILCETNFIAFVDDRCVLGPSWLIAVKRAMTNSYAVCGDYEKRANMKVENGVIIEPGELLGAGRGEGFMRTKDWWGGSYALPLDWCLEVNGWPEDMCDGLGSEDSQFGMTLLNSGFPMWYDSELKIIEDRTPGQIEGGLKRADKNSHLGQKAKSWDIVRCFRDKKTSQNSYDIRNLKDRVLINHEPFPLPSASDRDWYDGQLLSEME